MIVFVTKEWQKAKYVDKLSGKTLVVTCREAYQLSSGVIERLTDLDSSQEEAGTSSCREIKVCCGNNRI